MKKNLLLLLLLGTSIVFTNCNKDEDEDLTIDIIGEYIGAYESNTNSVINPYEITVTRIDNNNVSIRPKSGNEFEEIEIEIERTNISTISSLTNNNQQLEKSVIFTTGVPIAITLSIDPTGDAHTFGGEKQ